MADPSGVLLIDKPEGPTSHDVVAAVRRALHTRRVGHAGTLDPFATGLLLLCVGPATRLAEYATLLDKSYDATLRLGTATDTDDRTGEVTASSDAWRAVDEGELRAAFDTQRGELLQVPPAYSAKKVAGERSHRLARRGEAVELAASPVRVHSVEVTRFEPPDVDFVVTCSSGTYIRSIARDVGRALGCHAHLTRLRRSAIGSHRVDDALPLSTLDEVTASAALRPPITAVAHLPRLEVGEDDARRLVLGQRLAAASPDADADRAGTGGAPAVAVTRDGRLVAVAEVSGGTIRPRKVIADA